ncbi:MAG: zinc-ribbon domain-containing protein [Candidatus Heimdallarchaeota archaeon]|nr:zinc-ribbon domain-containing protein [Candidatus Heimdallarchaeota archaeon]MCK5047775.1 zinc-ribbon domain-containing protein [Candidatus Heimdallarchaeota archaeon]
MSEPTCYYHPERTAVEKCEKCGKLICLECKMVFHATKSRGFSSSSGLRSGHASSSSRRSYYDVRHEVCPVCYFDLQEESVARSKVGMYVAMGFVGFFMITFIMVFMPVFMFVDDVPAGGSFISLFILVPIMMLLIPGIMLFFFFYRTFYVNPKTTSDARAKKREFLRSVGQSSSYSGSPRISSSKKYKASSICNSCGDELEPGDQFCPGCGTERA